MESNGLCPEGCNIEPPAQEHTRESASVMQTIFETGIDAEQQMQLRNE